MNVAGATLERLRGQDGGDAAEDAESFTQGYEERSVLALGHPRDPALAEWFSGASRTLAGANVTERTAMTYSAVWGCVRVISSAIGILPCSLYENLPGGRKRIADAHPAHELVHYAPNSYQDPGQFFEQLTAHALTWRGGFAEALRNGAGLVSELHPITPDRVPPPEFSSGGRSLLYTVHNYTREDQRIPQEDMLHLRGLSFDGINGYSPVRLFAETIGVAMAAQSYAGEFFDKGTIPPVLLRHPRKLSEEAEEYILKMMKRRYAASNKQPVAIVGEDIQAQLLQQDIEKTQLLETQREMVRMVARIYGVPVHMLSDLERATFSNIEHQALEFVTHCILPWTLRWERLLQRVLIPREQWRRYYFKFNLAALLRGDLKSRYDSYALALNNGFKTIDEVRELEDDDPLDDGLGAKHRVPVNLVAVEDPPPEPQSAPPADPPAEEPPQRHLSDRLLEIAALYHANQVDRAAAVVLVQAAHHPQVLTTAAVRGICDALLGSEPPAAEPPPEDRLAKIDRVRLARAMAGLVTEAIQRTLRVEADRIRAAAKKPAEFLRQVEAFYAQRGTDYRYHAQTTIEAAVEALASTVDGEALGFAACARHRQRSIDELLELSGQVTAEGLAAAVEAHVEGWLNTRAAEEAGTIVHHIEEGC